jgi:hypothetical protein
MQVDVMKLAERVAESAGSLEEYERTMTSVRLALADQIRETLEMRIARMDDAVNTITAEVADRTVRRSRGPRLPEPNVFPTRDAN